MFSLNLIELHVLNEKQKEPYKQVLYFVDILYAMLFKNVLLYQSSECILYYYNG